LPIEHTRADEKSLSPLLVVATPSDCGAHLQSACEKKQGPSGRFPIIGDVTF